METKLKFDRQGLIPAIVVDDVSGEVLMLAFMNEEALRRTLETGQTHFFSRSRNTIWHKGEQSGNIQEVRALFVNCEENSLLFRVVQHGGAACHEGYRSCYFRRILPDGSYQIVTERVFDPQTVYQNWAADTQLRSAETEEAVNIAPDETRLTLEKALRQLYGAYLYLRDHDLSEESNTSRLLQERSWPYLASRLADELQELADVQSGEHAHTNRQADTILEGSQVSYWLFLLASACNITYNDFLPHDAILEGYSAQYSESRVIEMREDCLNLLTSGDPLKIVQGLQTGFTLVGWACAEAGVSPLAPAEFDLEQMRRKGLVK
ncbi:MAG: phosphoribosyl-AMP cyclohydrolase [Ktedonobacteraceae bacterium]|nr:phosphoribosyl-AMP cyclohydrolase [Ktedonobacteraceae bacterium]